MKPLDIYKEMMKKDHFSQWLGIELVEIKLGTCILKMSVRAEMCNGFGIAHGGISYSLSDSAFAFASNSYGKHAVSIETSISHTRPIKEADVLTAVAKMLNQGNRIAQYETSVTNQNDEIVALFKGTVYRMKKEWNNT